MISIVVTAILWAIDENQNVLASLVRKVLLVGFFAWLVTQWHTLSQTTVVNGFAALGLKAGGGAMSVSTFTDLALQDRHGGDQGDRRPDALRPEDRAGTGRVLRPHRRRS